jgi:hypothetical protein
MVRFGKLAVLIVALAAVLAACGWGETKPAVHVTDETAELTGMVHNTVAGPTDYWFEYGKTTSYGSSTPHRSINLPDPNTGATATERVVGLEEGTTYHAKLCALDADGHGVCGGDQPFATAGPEDWVSGAGLILKDPALGFQLSAGAFATSSPDGSNPAGDAGYINWERPATGGVSGPVSCLRVDGNRATIGFLGSPPDVFGEGPQPGTPRLLFVEDNGPTGDRVGFRQVADASVCPTATAADFPNFFPTTPRPLPPVISDGDFSVHDHGAP